ncbi:dihydrodiol dehydrogenase [Penicillium malachiteum]|uniref:dihydrodiol dehydrogenase n=1 Tax=Penicillium malachiteum TaxID=1324776 RepID=UPI002548048D|nr:dihydrodiol dehydrogenase [Penicillium malachiteum]KAJ5725345.1 dihydrodiol dehydrogenase [Penicillium malachiteum]
MEDLVREGLVRQIGISNFNQAQTEQILRHATIAPTVHEFECHLYLQQSEYVKWTLDHGMHPSLLSFASAKGLTVAQLALAWNMHRGVIVIPKSEHIERVAENFVAQSVSLSAADMEFLNSLDQKSRFNNPSKEWDVQLYSGLDGI